MSDFGERLEESLKQVADFAAGKAKPGAYRITQVDDDGNPTVVADFSEEFLAQIDAEVAAEETEAKRRADSHHLRLAIDMGRVLRASHDDYFDWIKDLAFHSGIVFGARKDRRSIGTWVRFLSWMHETYSQDDMRNRVEYLRLV